MHGMTRTSIRWFSSLAASLVMLFGTTAAMAHEFWLMPDRFSSPVGSSVRMRMFVGEQFSGELVGFYSTLIASAHHYTAGRDIDLTATAPEAAAADFAVTLREPGTHLLAIDTHSSQIDLEAGRFYAYLHDEGLDYVNQARGAAGRTATPGRERYRRNLKSLITAIAPGAAVPGSGAADTTYARVTGQRLEIVPQSDPQLLVAGQDVAVQVLWEGKPLPNALLKFWHRRGSQSVLIRVVTDAQGKAAYTPPFTGTWMASVVHMIPVTNVPNVDWDSYWANLTFSLPNR